MKERLEAKQRTIVLTDATLADNIDATPGNGRAWRILSGYGWHDEGAPLNCVYALDDLGAGGYRDLCPAANVASGVFMPLYTNVHCQDALVLRGGQTLRFNAAGKTVGHNVVIVLFVDEVLGETAYVG